MKDPLKDCGRDRNPRRGGVVPGMVALATLLGVFLGGALNAIAVPGSTPAADRPAVEPGPDANQRVAGRPGPLPRDSVIQLAPGVFRVGRVTIDANQRRVAIDGHVNMSSGIVELLACARYGKTHESVFAMEAEPYHIQVGLLLLGLEPTKRPLRFQGDKDTPTGDSVEVTVAWTDSTGKRVEVRGEDAILDLRTNQSMQRTHWVFVGSRVANGQFEAQVDGNIITTYHDPATIIDNPLEGGGDDTVYGVNSALVPKVGTPVTLTVRALSPPRSQPGRQEKKP
jgi:hypothetical protein